MKTISFTKLTDTLQISEHPDGFWLYDATRGMNLAMREKTRDDAFVEALKYYQTKLSALERTHAALVEKVQSFVDQFVPSDDD